ncbi:hypothetical protein B0H14DRAFT_2556866 [Mycena olivaceomarginata]|nr:hypothetical protein B0H14DRAFT_2556866 [Mycena olivaceomarginata]
MRVISSAFVILALSVTSILALPGENVPEKRSSACAITGNGARCRRTPTSSDILGEFFIGQSPTFSCRTTGPSENGPSGTNDKYESLGTEPRSMEYDASCLTAWLPAPALVSLHDGLELFSNVSE